MRWHWVIWGAVLGLATVLARAELPAPVARALQEAGLPPESLGVVVQRLSDGNTALSHGAHRSLSPASTLKPLTAIVALERLGPAWRGRSELRTAAPLEGGVLQGDLALRGLADVDLDAEAFAGMLRTLRFQGVREIRGDLRLDLTHFQPARTDVGLAPFDDTPEFRYNVVPDALLLATYLVQLDLAAEGTGVRAALHPPLDRVRLEPAMTLVERACEDWEDGWILPEVVREAGGTIVVRLPGEFPRGCSATTRVSVLDRVEFADRLFRATWSALGGAFTGVVREGPSPAGSRLLAVHRSRTLAEVARDINKRSDNPVTRVMYLAVGAKAQEAAAAAARPVRPTADHAEAEVRAWLAAQGIDGEGLVLENGSGLSRSERIRPAQLAAVLRTARRSPWAPEFLATFPIVGVDGGMQSRLKGTPAAGGRARIKTGTLRDASAVAGYVMDSAGETFVVVAILNGEKANRRVARPVLDAVIDWVARSRGLGDTFP